MSAIQFLVEWALRSSVLIVSGALLLRVLRVKDPTIRLGTMTALLFISLAIPALNSALPKLPLPVMRTTSVRVDGPVLIYDAASKPTHAIPDSDLSAGGASGVESPRVDAAPPATRANADAGSHASAVSKRFNWVHAAIVAYVLVALTLFLRFCFGLAISLRILRGSRVTHQSTEGIEIRESERVASPVTLGILRPVIVMPNDWLSWERQKLDAILAHECSHIRRHDPAVQLLSALHRILLWHTPFSWFLHRQIVRMAEEVCDDAAVATTQDRTLYAEVLLDFMRRGVWRASWQGVPVSRYGPADQRIHRILDGTGLSRGFTARSVAAILTLGLPLAYVVACARPQSRSQEQTKTVQTSPVPNLQKPPQAAAPEVVGRINEGDLHARRGEWDDAIASYRAEMKLDPSNSELRQKLDRAIKDCEKEKAVLGEHLSCGAARPAVSLDPAQNSMTLSRIRMGDFHLGRGEYDDAISAYKDGLRLDPSNTRIRQKLDIAINKCREEESLLHEGLRCEQALSALPVSPTRNPAAQRQITLGDFHLGRGEYDDAISAYKAGLKLDPSNTALREKLDTAIKGCEKEESVLNEGLSCEKAPPASTVLLPPNPAIQRKITLGDFHLGRGEYDEAVAVYQDGLKLDPSNDALRHKLDFAIKACKREVSILNNGLGCGASNPTVSPSPTPTLAPRAGPVVATSTDRSRSAKAGINMGDFHLARGEYGDAIAAYQAGLRVDPANTTLEEKLHAAIRACQKDNAVLNEGLNCGLSTPVVKLIPSGDFTRWDKPVTRGQIIPDNTIDGGLKPQGSLNLPPLENAPPQAFVIFVIGIDQNGNVIPGRTMSDDNRLALPVLAAAKGWKFEPPTVNGTPVSTNIQVIVTF